MALKLTTAGESHGPGLTCVVEGLPAGLVLDREAIDRDMARRQLGHGRGGRMKIEKDHAVVTGGVRHGVTLGGPIALEVPNRDYANWEERMNPWPVDAAVERSTCRGPATPTSSARGSTARPTCATSSSARPRARPPRASRAARWPRSSCAPSASRSSRTSCRSGPSPPRRPPTWASPPSRGVDEDPVRCLDPEASAAMVEHINVQRKANESIGGVFEVRAYGVVPGVGSHVSWEERLDGRLAMALASIQSCKGVGLGDGFDLAGDARLAGPRRDLPLRGARLLPRDEPLPAASRAA